MGRPRADSEPFDEVSVLRMIRGEGARGASPADRNEVIRRMALAGYSDGQIAHATGMWRNTVWRIRTERLRMESPLGFPSNGSSCTKVGPTRPKVRDRRVLHSQPVEK